jgi:hypothetical protein
LFVRNHKLQQTTKRIALMYFPTAMHLADYSKVC